MSAPDREAYGARQAQLLDALLRGDEPPAGFDAAQAAAAGSSLRRKRGHAVAQAWPALAVALGDAFATRFDAFARTVDAPPSGSPLEDGLAFARTLDDLAALGDDVRAELLLARAALRRRGLFVAAAWLRRPRPRVLVVVRVPLLGALHRSVPRRGRRAG